MMNKRYLFVGAIIVVAIAVIVAAFLIFKPAFFSSDSETARLTALVAKSPDDARLRQALGMRLLGKGDYKGAETHLLIAMNIEPYNTDILQSVGMLYYRKGEPHKALSYWRTILEIDPGNALVWELVNKVSAEEKGAKPSHGSASQAVNPEWERLYKTGQDKYQAKDYAGAIVAFKKAAKINPDDFRTWFNIGAAYYEMRDLANAKENWEKALKLKKDDMLVKRLITLAEQGIWRKESVADIRRRLEKEPDDWELHARLADALAREKATADKAEKEYLEVLRLNPAHADTYFKLIDLSLRLERHAKAVAYSGALVKKRPQDEDAKKMHETLKRLKKFFDDGAGNWARLGMGGYMEMTPVRIGNETLHIDRFEVTNAAYDAFLKSSGHLPPPAWESAALKGKENAPVVNVSWYDAIAYCRWVGKRLPTEEEWRSAAIGNAKHKYPWGDDFDKTKANTVEAGYRMAVPVGSFPAQNGLHDMIGNVSEWTMTGDEIKVKKGGSFMSDAKGSATSSEQKSRPEARDGETGFRCARDEN
ncbi:MAG: SUMF1/EgtB/PvdO family nonheme iron enzyme [Deltaproteobacteria bacterium]|nr:SUMF1/EgtB/PvdO family nonheme iron enzyme [Deltaproteobacteria bacterium]